MARRKKKPIEAEQGMTVRVKGRGKTDVYLRSRAMNDKGWWGILKGRYVIPVRDEDIRSVVTP